MSDKIKVVSTAYFGRETIVTVACNDFASSGTAKCNPSDKFSRDIGYSIAFSRALRTLSQEMETTWISRAISYKNWKSKQRTKKNGVSDAKSLQKVRDTQTPDNRILVSSEAD